MIGVHITIGGNTFDANGDFEIDEPFLDLFEAWVDAVSDSTTDADAQIDVLDTQTNALASAVAAATPVK